MQNNNMAGHIVKSVLFSLILALLAFIVLSFSSAICAALTENMTLIIILPLLLLAFIWLTTKALSAIATRMSFLYWIFCFLFTLLVFILALTKNIRLNFGTSRVVGEEKPPIGWNDYLPWHLSLMMFLIPELDGYWTTYLNTEITINGYGDVINSVSWISREYTSGTFIKLVAGAIIASIASVLSATAGTIGIWITFLVEGIYCLALAVINFKNFMEY